MSDPLSPDCPSVAELESWLDAGRPPGDLSTHIAACPACDERIAEIDANNDLLARLGSSHAANPPVVDLHPLRDAVPGYRIEDELHRGGQGVVYRALQIATNRVVAIKVLLSGVLATPEQRRRFEREVDLAASLRHPNIVTVFDGGCTEDGRLWCAMELIEGERLDAWVEARSDTLTRGAILDLFVRICDAVTHAHQRGVIHRDLKPANMLVDERGEPRVLDFGLARPARTELDTETTIEGSLIGTIAWCSPEQARGDLAAVDVRSDVYALGVILYELLTGRFPHDVGGPLAEVLTRISEQDPAPPRAESHGANRFRVDRDLETIVLTALARDPQRRYQSADELRRDIVRFLAHEPIDARRDSTWYVLGRAIRRHRLESAAGLVFVLLLAAFGVSMTIMYGRAKAEAEKVAKINIFLEDTLGSVQPAPGEDAVTVAALLEEGEHWIELVLADDPEVEAAVQAIIGNGYRNIRRFDDAEHLLTAALATRRRVFGDEHVEVARSLSALGHLRRDQARLDEARSLFDAALAIRTSALGADDLQTAMTRASLARVDRDAGDLDAAEAALRDVLVIRRNTLGERHSDVAMTHFSLARIAELRGDLDEAVHEHDLALATRRAVLHRQHPDLARSLEALARLEAARGNTERAAAYARERASLRE